MTKRSIATLIGLAILLGGGAAARSQQLPDLLGQTDSTSASAGTGSVSTGPGGSRIQAGSASVRTTAGTAPAGASGARQGQAPAGTTGVQAGQPDRTSIGFVEEFRFVAPETVTAKGRFTDSTRITDPRIGEKIVINGNVTYEDLPARAAGEERRRAVVMWQSLERNDADRRAKLDEPLTSRFSSDVGRTPQIEPGTNVTAEGDVTAALSRARELLEDEKREEDEKAARMSAGGTQPGASQRPVSASGAGAADNPILGNMQVPELKEFSDPEAPADTPTYGETTDGCPVRVDEAQGVAIVQSRQTEDGQPTGECSDTMTRLPIKRSYAACSDQIDLSGMVARAQFRTYYTGADGTVWLSECTPDEERAYPLERTEEGCTRELNAAGQMVVNQRTIYRDGNGALHVVEECGPSGQALEVSKDYLSCTDYVDMQSRIARPQYQRLVDEADNSRTILSDCQPDESVSWPIIDETETCSIVERIGSQRAIQQVRSVYTRNGSAGDGSKVEVIGCHDSDTIFQIEKDYSVCSDFMDLARRIAAPRYKQVWTDDEGTRHEVTPDCQIDGALETMMTEDTDSCGIRADMGAMEMVQWARLVYTNRRGQEVVARDCEPTSQRWQIKQTRMGCSDVVDLPSLTAYASRRLYWIDRNAQTQELGECEPDPEQPYDILPTTDGCAMQLNADGTALLENFRLIYEDRAGRTHVVKDCELSGNEYQIQRDYAACSDALDFVGRQARPRYKEFWNDLNGQRHVISDCLVDGEQSFAFEDTAEGCSDQVRHAAGYVMRQVRTRYYDGEGAEIEVVACHDSETTFAIEKQWGVCDDVIDLARGKAWPQYKSIWTNDQGEVTILSECQPNEATPFPLVVNEDACGIHQDTEAGLMVQWGRVEYTDRDGTLQIVTECAPTNKTYEIQRSYSVCDDKVDLQNGVVHPQYRRYWMDPAGNMKFLDGNCIVDPDQSFEIVENAQSCTPTVNIADLEAIINTRLVYINRDNQQVMVRDCGASQPPQTVAMYMERLGCTYRQDPAGQQAIGQMKAVYEWNGALVTSSGCIDTDERFPYQRYRGLCPNIEDLDARLVTPQYMLGFVGWDNDTHYVSQCIPDQSAAVAINKERCASNFVHNMGGSITYGTAINYYIDPYTSVRKNLTGCVQNNDESYQHQTEIQGYNNYDQYLYSRPKTAIYVQTQDGRVDLSPATERPGAPNIAYTYLSQQDIPNGQVYYDTCQQYEKTTRQASYRRSDGTTYVRTIGEGAVVDRGNACQVSSFNEPINAEVWPVYYNGADGDVSGTWDYRCTWQQKVVYTRNDGHQWSTTGAQSSNTGREARTGILMGTSISLSMGYNQSMRRDFDNRFFVYGRDVHIHLTCWGN